MYKSINSLAIILFFILGTTHSFAQQGVSNEINNMRARGELFELSEGIFQIAETPISEVGGYFNNPEDVVYLEYDQSILKNSNHSVSLEVPFQGTTLTLDLMDVSDQFKDIDIEVRGKDDYVASTVYKHYRGIVRGDTRSLVSLSFFEGDVMGVISSDDGNLNIAKLKNSDDIIIFNDKDVKDESDFACHTDADADFKGYNSSMLMASPNSQTALSTSGKCVGFYFETEFDMFQSLGSLGNVANYVTSLYNEVATIYQNENITTRISQLVIWAIADPYVSTNTFGLLTEFQNQISTLNGDLGQLLTFRNVGGGRAAGFNGICNPDVDQSLCVSGNLSSTVVPFPTYSWNVMVLSHEFGHLFGSRHTHACVWNGNNTAIDGCSGFTEGSCAVPPPPPAGGTIMSYCHINAVGINFSLGFGPQPGNVIRDNVDNGACLLACCPEHVVIAPDVPAFGVDHQEAEFTITAFNTVNANAEAVYHAGDEVLLLDDFDALNGSEFRAYIEGCTGVFVKSANSEESTDSDLLGYSVLEALKLSPNPTRDEFTIDLTKSDFTWDLSEIEIYDLKGQRVILESFVEIGRNTFRANIAHLDKGVYVIKLFKLESNESYVKRVVKL